MTQWHKLSPEEALAELNSREDGLEQAEAELRLAQHGSNVLKGKPKPPAILVFAKQFLSPLIYVLLAAAIISLVVGHYIDAVVILGVLLLNAAIGYIQETRAEKAMEALLNLPDVRIDGFLCPGHVSVILGVDLAALVYTSGSTGNPP